MVRTLLTCRHHFPISRSAVSHRRVQTLKRLSAYALRVYLKRYLSKFEVSPEVDSEIGFTFTACVMTVLTSSFPFG